MGWVTEVEGEIPKEMVGTLLRNGPAMYERDGFVKSYLDGDGMVTSIAIKDGKACPKQVCAPRTLRQGGGTRTVHRAEHLHRERSEKAGVVLQIV